MIGHTLIDGNNLLHAMHAHAPVPHVGRETLVRIVEKWAYQGEERVTLVFDGSAPKGELARQMSSKRIKVVFAAPQSADDVIVEKLRQARQPSSITVITDDTAIAHEARRRRAGHIGCLSYIETLYAPKNEKRQETPQSEALDGPDGTDKPENVSQEEIERWVEFFEDDLGSIDERDYR